jgi:hypothetical protein
MTLRLAGFGGVEGMVFLCSLCMCDVFLYGF